MLSVTKSFWRRPIVHYVLSAAAVVGAFLLRQGFSAYFGNNLAYITLSPAVMFAAMIGGLGPGLFATALAMLLAAWGILYPLDTTDRIGLSLFAAMGLFMNVVAWLYHRARDRAARFEKELAVRAEHARAAAESERQRQLLAVTLGSIGDGVIVTDITSCVTFLNGEAERLTGWRNDEASGRPLVEVFHIINEETRQEVENPADKVLRLGTTVGLANHTLLIARDGRETPIDDSGAPILLGDGTVHGVVLVFRDFTQRRAAEEELNRAKREWERTFDSAPDLIALIDPHHRILRANKAMAEHLGLTPEECVGLPCFRCAHGMECPPEGCPHAELLNDGCAHSAEIFEHRLGGNFLVTCTPLCDEQGRLTASVHIAHDITRRKQAEAALRESEFFFRQAIESIPGMVFTTRPDGYCVYQSQQWVDYTGVPMSEHLGDGWNKLLHPGDRPRAYEAWRAAVDGRAPYDLEYRVRRHDGQHEWFKVRGCPIRNATGEIVRWFGVATNIDEFKQAEAALLQRTERLALMSEAAAHLLAAEDPTRMVRELFDKVCAHLNVHAYFNFMVNEAGDALYLDSYAGIPERAAHLIERLEFGQAICGTVAATRMPMHVEDVQQSEDGKVKLIKSYGIRAYCCHPLMAGERLLGTLSFGTRAKDRFDEDEVKFMRTMCHYVAMAKDRMRLEKELRQHITELAEADRRKDEYLAMLAHELRNPLAPVRNAVAVLRLAGPNESIMQRQRGIIDRQVTHMARLLDDLLDVSRITRGKITLQKKPLILMDVLTHAIETVTPLIETRRHTLHLGLPTADLRVEGDLDRLAQVVGNLLTNAAKYTPEGGQIWLDATRENGQAVVRVRDNGVGIAPEMLPRIFDLFTQAERSMDRSLGGLGIGLTMVQSLVEMHGGGVTARSDGLGQGSEFTVSIPALPEDTETPTLVEYPTDGNEQL